MKTFDDFEVHHAASIIAAARADLGEDLGGFSVVDLLADNLPRASLDECRELARLADASLKGAA